MSNYGNLIRTSAHLILVLKSEIVAERSHHSHGAFFSSQVLDPLVDISYKALWQSHQHPEIVRSEDIANILTAASRFDLREDHSMEHLVSIKLA
jgi:hypothetical protein